MRWLLKLVCPPNGVTLDLFAGSGTTGVAAREEGTRCILIEREQTYFDIMRRRIEAATVQTDLFVDVPRVEASPQQRLFAEEER